MPEEPLIFVQVALVQGMADNVQVLLDRELPLADTSEVDAAIFYSITNAQQGLVGISFGNFLIKRVVDQLASEFPKIKTFATLSPIPGLRKWIDETIAGGDAELLAGDERSALKDASGHAIGSKGQFKSILETAHWADDERIAEALRPTLMRLAARYLLQAKRASGTARDSVSHFHLTNGARIDRINWLGDRSIKGIAQSAGIMVNYVYDLDDIENNHETYTANGSIAASSAVRNLIKS